MTRATLKHYICFTHSRTFISYTRSHTKSVACIAKKCRKLNSINYETLNYETIHVECASEKDRDQTTRGWKVIPIRVNYISNNIILYGQVKSANENKVLVLFNITYVY